MASAQSAGVPADVSRRPEEEEDNLAGMEQEDVIFFKFKDGVFHYIRTQFPPPPSL